VNSQQATTVCDRETFTAFISARETFVEFASRIIPSFFHVDESHCMIVAVDYQRHMYPDEACHSLRQRKTRDISKIVEFHFEFANFASRMLSRLGDLTVLIKSEENDHLK